MKRLTLWTVLMWSLSLSVQASLIAYEGFNYDAGLKIGGLSGGSGWGAAWTQPNGTDLVTIQDSAALAYTDGNSQALPVEGRGLLIGRTFRSANRVLAQTHSDPGVYWFSFLIQPTYVLSETEANRLRLYVRNGATDRLITGKPNADEHYGMIAGGNTVYTTVSGEVDVEGVFPVQLLVLRYEIGVGADDGQVHLFMNPLLGSEPSILSADAAITGLNSANMSFDRLHLDGIGGGATSTSRGRFDEIRIGTDYVSVIPEPASAGLAVMAGLLLLRRRLRR